MCKIRECLFLAKSCIINNFKLLCVSCFNYKYIDEVMINREISSYNKYCKKLNKFYICNTIHNIAYLYKYLNYNKPIRSIQFSYKKKYIDMRTLREARQEEIIIDKLYNES